MEGNEKKQGRRKEEKKERKKGKREKEKEGKRKRETKEKGIWREVKGRTFEGRRELIEEIMEDALKKRIEMLGVWEEWEREGYYVSRAEG